MGKKLLKEGKEVAKLLETRVEIAWNWTETKKPTELVSVSYR